MDIGGPTNIRHVAHVTFDRFDGFLGLPSEFEPDVPRKAPSASATVFGVSTESMQLSYDSRGNCVPVILLLLQSRLYDQGGLQAEGVFRITGENSEEEFVREQLNKGIIPDGIDVHCLAGLIKVLVVIVNHLTFVFENGRPEFDYVCVCGFRLGSESCREGYWILCHRSK
jgi:hypothetical protein